MVETGTVPDADDAPQSHRWWTPNWIPLAFALGFALAMVRTPMLDFWKSSQGRRLAANGEKRLANRDIPGAGRFLQSALNRAPDEPAVLRLTARFCTVAGLPEALTYWEQLFSRITPTEEDLQGYVQAAQAVGRLDKSGPVIQQLIRSNPRDRRFQWLLLDQLLLIGDHPNAVAAARLGLEEASDDPERVLTLARVLLETRDPRAGEEAFRHLKRMAAAGPLRTEALRMMGQLEGLPDTEQAWLLRELEVLPQNALSDRLLAADLRIQVQPVRKSEWISGVRDRETGGPLGVSERLELVGWFRKHQSHAEAERLLPMEMVSTNRALAIAWMELLGETRRWDDLERFSTVGLQTLDPLAADCAGALSAAGRGDFEGAVKRLDQAAQRNATRPEVLVELAQFAESIGQQDTAVLIWLSALYRSGLEAVAAPQLLRLVRSRPARGFGEASEAIRIERSVYASLSRVLGGEPVVQTQLAYLEGLLGENLSESEERMRQLIAKKPDMVAPVATLGLILLRQNRPEPALALMEGRPIDWTVQEPRWRAVYAGILRANRLQDRARRAVAGLHQGLFLDMELDLAGELPPAPGAPAR